MSRPLFRVAHRVVIRRRMVPPMEGKGSPLHPPVQPRRRLGGLRRGVVLLVPLVALTGCGPRPGWEVQRLAEANLPRLSEAELAGCEQKLALDREISTPADPTNFGERRGVDAFGRALPDRPQLIVLHETVIPADATVRLFQTAHPKDEDQVSYHLLVDRSGRRLRIVPDEKRAFGAGMAAFGDFTVRVRESSVGSVNNVALHLSLETPADGRGDTAAHSGYTPEQYATTAAQVLLWQARHGIPISRLTTHQAVDRSRSRYDPRAFRWDRFDAAYRKAASLCELTAYDNGRATY